MGRVCACVHSSVRGMKKTQAIFTEVDIVGRFGVIRPRLSYQTCLVVKIIRHLVADVRRRGHYITSTSSQVYKQYRVDEELERPGQRIEIRMNTTQPHDNDDTDADVHHAVDPY